MFKPKLLVLLATLAPLTPHAAPFWGAKESRPPETAPVQLQPGEFVWNPVASQVGPILVLVSLDEQRAYVYRNGVQIGYTTISSGKTGHDTPTGVFVILEKDKDHRSSKYNSAPMPYTQRLTWDGVALHAGGLPGYPSSHGCVHLPSKFAEELFAVSPMGMTVVVANERSAPSEVVHPPAFSPVDAESGATDKKYLPVPDPSRLHWLAVSMRGHDDGGRILPQEASARVSMPAGFARAVGLLLAPGTTLFITDAPILAQNTRTDFTVLSNEAPDSSDL